MIDKAIIFKGSKRDFNKFLGSKGIDENSDYISFMELIQLYNSRIRTRDSSTPENFEGDIYDYDYCVIKSEDYASVLEHVILNFKNIVNLNANIGTVFLHNPPKRIEQSLASEIEDIEYEFSEYRPVLQEDLHSIYKHLNQNVMNQENAILDIVSNLYKTSVMNEKPIVILLYGPSGVGKTETARSLSEYYGGDLLRIQFSMMQTSDSMRYIFGGSHSEASLAKDLYGRETNIVLIDEFDKVNSIFYNAFYQLFDEGRLVDANYDLNLQKCIFILTSNFNSISEIENTLGPEMYSRIGETIQYGLLTIEFKEKIIEKHYSEIIENLSIDEIMVIEETEVLEWFKENAAHYVNIRSLKTEIENVIFKVLTKKLIEDIIVEE